MQQLEPPQATLELFSATRRRGMAASLMAQRAWRGITPNGDWAAQWLKELPRVAALVAVAQHGAAVDGSLSVGAALEEQGFPEQPLGMVNPKGFAGWVESVDGELLIPVETKLYEPILRARQSTGSPVEMLNAGRRHLDMLVRGAVADAAAKATSAQVTATRNAERVWYDPPPYCQRCAAITGRRMKWNSPEFKRHKQCDGQISTVSSRDDRRGWGMDDEQVTDYTEAQRKAIEDGADAYQVINAKTGLLDRRSGGRTGLTDGGLRTYQTRSRKRDPRTRLTPKGIYAQAGDDRAAAVELLRANGYILAGRAPPQNHPAQMAGQQPTPGGTHVRDHPRGPARAGRERAHHRAAQDLRRRVRRQPPQGGREVPHRSQGQRCRSPEAAGAGAGEPVRAGEGEEGDRSGPR